MLPAGWVVVPRDGSAVVTEVAISLGVADTVLERRAEGARLGADLTRLESDVAVADTAAGTASEAADAARVALETARASEARSAGERRAAEERERLAARDLEAVLREAAWTTAQAERLRQEQERASADLAAMEAPSATDRVTADGRPTGGDDASAIETWEDRAAQLRARRDRAAEAVAARDATRREAEGRRARAEAAVALGEERMARTDREVADLETRAQGLVEARETLRTDLATAIAAEAAARAALGEIHAADAAQRDRLAAAERDAAGTRDRLRATDERLRLADRDELEARLGLDALRDAVLVDLAGLGDLGLLRLAESAGVTLAPARTPVVDEIAQPVDAALADEATTEGSTSELEAVLDRAAALWAASPPTEPPPTAGRLAQLRRRFHELGATNPYAVEEYAELRQRLESLEAQWGDLRTAITRTRELIAELETMITDQFQTTFRALETAFERRFEQLFGGGFARLSLTDPSDLGATGVEIVARPPGKKPQALSMLSGGERALTAVALLFAMLEVRPVPFCVLDEVDAALDEANIGRFADALRSLAHQTQFIVITHNRGTIEAADALYGVTVGDDSVSRVISLRLDEATALAEGRRGELAPAG